ncbi:anti-sigma factor [Streptomyces sp. SP18ES09]|uniref:anti-sigma factor n=1 Tax=Streptomyces sp. SP18ES09 TaxID=3002532 RepID=UPI002E793A76|nr:anti-sigma factor [Streptomyces sp. SP18ES09]MEE1820102.1 anti-sigma factor [Streptomyces sp. SP18ES09]
MTSAENPHDAVGAYVLHALPPEEEAAFENHLAACEACRREVDELRGATARLGGVMSATAPAELRRRTLDQVRATRQEQTRPLPRQGRRLARMALAASLASAVAFGGVAVWQHREAGDARARAVQAEERARDSVAAVGDVLTATDATLYSERLSGGASAAVVVSRSQDRAVFTARHLPDLGGARVYELWYAAGSGALRPAGLLPGTGVRDTRLMEGPLDDAVAVGITVEPAGGSSQPTSEPLGIIPLTA